MLNHVMVGVSDLDRAKAFYDATLGVLGAGELKVFLHVTLPLAMVLFREDDVQLAADDGLNPCVLAGLRKLQSAKKIAPIRNAYGG